MCQSVRAVELSVDLSKLVSVCMCVCVCVFVFVRVCVYVFCTTKLWNSDTGELLSTMEGHTAEVVRRWPILDVYCYTLTKRC